MTAIAAASVLIKVTLILGLALAGARLARRSRAAVRHVLLAASFVVLPILPVASIVAPAVSVAIPAAVQQAIDPLTVDPVAPAPLAPSTATVSVAPPAASGSWWPSLSAFLLGSWIAGAAIFLLPVVLGLRQVDSLRRSAFPWVEGRAVAAGLGREIGIRRTVDVRIHEALPGPMTCGILSPAIVMPIDAPTWPAEDLRRALVHELEHVRRHDWLTQCLARVVAAGYWFHPAVWVAWRQLALEAERACDDAVLLSTCRDLDGSTSTDRAGESSTAYADQLVVLARRLKTAYAEGGQSASRQPQLAMANRSDLATRVVAVLDSSQARGRAGARYIVVAIVATTILGAGLSSFRIVAAPGSQAQAPSGQPKPKYDTASIKPCEVEPVPTGARGTAGGTNATFSPGRFFVPCVTTEQLIYLAYASYGAREDERLLNDDAGTASNATKIRGGPSWVHSLRDKYSIEATAAGATERTVLMGSMLQSLLEDRFHLKIHRETEEVPLFDLTVAKSGLKLKPMKDGDCDPSAAPGTDPSVGKPKCGNLMMAGDTDTTRWSFYGFRLSTLASQLSRALGVHVIDKTGVTDEFIFRFEFRRDDATSGDAASVYTALEEQLGLKLEKTKGPRGFIVIDAIDRPTPDGPLVIIPAPSRARGAGDRRQ